MLMDPRPPHELLAWGRGLLEPALRAAVHTLPAGVRPVAEFHFGWCDEFGYATDGAGADPLHATLALLSAEAAGRAHDVVLPAAIAVELVHNFCLLHDDVVDDDHEEHRRPPTARTLFGRGPVILAGAALQTLAFTTLAAAGGARARAATRVLSASVQDLLTARTACRTAALSGCACALGELFAAGEPRRGGAARKRRATEELRSLATSVGADVGHEAVAGARRQYVA